MRFNRRKLEEFWAFVAERARVGERRAALEKPPWTDDPLLQRVRFCNPWRELDRGTQYAYHNVLCAKEDRTDVLLNVMVYRLVGRIESHQATGFLRRSDFDGADFYHALWERSRQAPIFASAYMVNNYAAERSHSKLWAVTRLVERLVHRWQDAPPGSALNPLPGSREGAFEWLMAHDGWGPFLAHQVLVDVSYPLDRRNGVEHRSEAERTAGRLFPEWGSNWSWAYSGYGTARGLKRLKMDGDPDLAYLLALSRASAGELERRAAPMALDEEGRGVDLSVANVCNCLCEWDKYYRIKRGELSGRTFDPDASFRAAREEAGHGHQWDLF